MINLSELGYKQRKVILFILFIGIIYGIISYFTLPAQEDPELQFRNAQIVTNFPGMSPERVELLITKKIEEAVRQIPEVEKITSTSITGTSFVNVKVYDSYFNLDDIWQDLRNKVDNVQSSLPMGTFRSIVNDDFGNVAVINLALTADGFSLADMKDMAEHIRTQLYTVKGLKKIELLGIQPERIYLEIDNNKLSSLGVNPQYLISTLQQQNIISPGGIIDTGKATIVVEPTGNFATVDEIGETLTNIPIGSNKLTAIKDIVTIKKGYIDPPLNKTYHNGKQAIILAVSMRSGYNILKLSPEIKQKIHEITNDIPYGYNLDVVIDQADHVNRTINSVSMNVLQTLGIILFVVMIFLGFRTGLIVGTIVPAVILLTLVVMQFSGIQLDRISLATIIISLGLLVDNGIVVTEDFKRRLQEGQDKAQILIECGKELTIPLLISSVSTILFFLPLMLADHVSGEYTRSVSLIILITLMISWCFSIIVTPTICFNNLTIDKSEKKAKVDVIFDKLIAIYKKIIQVLLKFKLITVLLFIVLFIISVMIYSSLPKKFFPESDRPSILVYLDFPAGTSAREATENIESINKFIANKQMFPDIDSFLSYSGFAGPRFILNHPIFEPAANKGFILIDVPNSALVEETILSLRKKFPNHFPNASIVAKKVFLGPSDSKVIEIKLSGPDADYIYDKSKEVKKILNNIPGTMDVKTDWENRIIKLVVKINQLKARRAGITSSDISRAMQGYFSGTEISQFRKNDNIIPIIIRAKDKERFNLDYVRSISIYSSLKNISIPLFQIADFKIENQYSRIKRQNMSRNIIVEGNHNTISAQDLKEIIEPDIKKLQKKLRPNHHVEFTGVVADSSDAQQAMAKNIPICLLMVILLLIIQFNSYKRTIIIVLTMPLSIIGATVGLYVMNAPVGFMSVLGLYALMGIIINNGIILIDKIDLERQNCSDIDSAIISASVLRLRPIMIATITTILGLFPLILYQDPLFYSMACAIAFGLGIGTVLTLGLVPILYKIFIGKEKL